MRQPATLSVVVIGRNEGSRLVRCLEAVHAMRWSPGGVEIIYVDSASSDDSVARARALGARVVTLEPGRPSAARARNAGWRLARAPLVLFLDGDTVVDPDFAERAARALADGTVAIVWGHRRELDPGASIYQRVLDLDWVYPPGPSEFCGGDALVRRAVLADVAGFDETLIAGEEPEMCQRLRARGHVILHLDAPMTGHDLGITRWRQYWTRAVRAGHAYAEVSQRTRDRQPPLWQGEARRNVAHAGALLLVPAAGLVAAVATGSALPAVAGPIWLLALAGRSARRARWKGGNALTRLLYGLHAHVQQVPILVGQIAYHAARRAGRRRGLIEYREVGR